MTEPKYPEVQLSIDITGSGGNAFVIMARAENEMKSYGIEKEVISEYTKKAMSGDYTNLLATTHEYISFDETGTHDFEF